MIASLKLAKNVVLHVDDKEKLLSNRIWVFLNKLKSEIENSHSKKITNEENNEMNPSWWDEYEPKNADLKNDKIEQKSKVFKKWIVYCKHRATARALESFLDDMSCSPLEYPTFVELLELMYNDKRDTIFMALEKPDIHNSITWADHMGCKDVIKRLKKDTDKYVDSFLSPTLKSGILLISGAIPKLELSLYTDDGFPKGYGRY